MAKPLNSLEQYLDRLAHNWMQERQAHIEPKWHRNLRMVKGEDFRPEISEVEFKKGEGGSEKGHEWRSKAIINITRVKVYSVYSMLLDVTLPNGEILFSLEPNPFPFITVPEDQKKAEKEARSMMESGIKQQLKERKMDRQFMKKLLSKLYYGLCWSKYNFEDIEYSGHQPVEAVDEQGQPVQRWQPYQITKKVPGHSYVSVWGVFWDLESEDHEKGQGVFERKPIDLFELASKKGQDWYLDEAIDKVIEEWEQENLEKTDSLTPGLREIAKRRKIIDNREFWVRVPSKIVDRFEEEELGEIAKGEEPSMDIITDQEETGEED
jgi:hypothetical protein